MDKNQAVIDFLFSCPQIANNPLFFNFSQAEDNNKQLVTVANDKAIERPYIDGSVLKRYTFTIIDYRSVIYQAVVNKTGFANENVDEMMDVQSIIGWIEEQNDNMNFPDFGEDCVVEEIKALTDSPNLSGVDSSVTPALAKYNVSVQIQYLDKSKVTWNKSQKG
jgi:hypothetical protein